MTRGRDMEREPTGREVRVVRVGLLGQVGVSSRSGLRKVEAGEWLFPLTMGSWHFG
jgi:hypothetical protein